ncbi:MAG: DNA-3-methyladenine glycosylase family protein [Terriglobales bacterium]
MSGSTAQPYPFDHRRAVRHLRASHPHMEALVARVGRFRMPMETHAEPFHALLRAIVFQQLHGTAARAILARIETQIGQWAPPTPAQVLRASDDALRATGLSRQKLAAVRELAAKTESGVVCGWHEIAELPDEAIITRFTQVRGVGPWTVQMMLIFRLGRPDVLPIHDYGVQQGYQLAYRKRRLPTPRELAKAGDAWRPWRSVASWYFWQAVRLKRAQARAPASQS